ncbi:FmdB family transcriptional regulator [Microbacterium sp. cx-55]|uniref:FmdB family zinc ribbon protein n=1 Tax=Microbacterium sp. cx-55 TaxID=2875948 RepID=UPI001CBF769C|nr:FmdB family zinc ribbon protein [Microbacterium sp. cx-55]MBZ4488199.1 FmdB family transcriptional regulator [Microbacterium sp. cx-55]UGB34394.1 FmdB family transcriptional regulator [Microbacterium sp. cx-55]
MPTYAYACKSCGHRFDAVQAFSDSALTECPVCGGELRKQYGSIGVTFNGSGFYRTDSRAAAGGSSSSNGSSNSEKKSDSSSSTGGGSGASSASSTSGTTSSSAPAAS